MLEKYGYSDSTPWEELEERISQAVVLGLPFLSRVLEQHKLQMNPEVPLNFNKAAGVAKTDPHALTKKFTIDGDGNVLIVEY